MNHVHNLNLQANCLLFHNNIFPINFFVKTIRSSRCGLQIIGQPYHCLREPKRHTAELNPGRLTNMTHSEANPEGRE